MERNRERRPFDRSMTSAMRTLACGILMAAVLGCATGRRYETGAVRFEDFNSGIVILHRDEEGSHYSFLHESIVDMGARWHGAQYSNTLGGLILWVNVPGSTWLVYPFQYNDLTGEKTAFGIGSGESDLRLSLLWGFLSLGREWNILWVRGFWAGKDDPVFRKAAPDSVREAFKAYVKAPAS